MKRHYLVTGGSGFLGSALVRALLQAGHRVRVLDDNSRGHPRRLADLAGRFEFIAGDIRDAACVRRAAQGVDSVCHLAFVNGTEFFYRRPDLVLDVGVKGMVNVVDACIANGVPELVVASSSEVYQTPPRVPTDESVPLVIPDPHNPRYSYAGAKLISELMALHCGRGTFERVLIFRPHNVYGPDMGQEHVIPQLALRARHLHERTHPGSVLALPIQGTGQERRAFCFIDDFTRAVLLLLEHGTHREIYHVGTPQETTIADVARLIAKSYGREVRLIASGRPAGGTLRRCPDISKLAALGYAPAVSLGEGIARTLAWYDAHHAEIPVTSALEVPR